MSIIRHKQLSLLEREELGQYAAEHGINVAAKHFDKHYATAKHWMNKYVNQENLTNIKVNPLTDDDYEYLDSFSYLVGMYSLSKIKLENSLPYSVDTLTKYYKKQNIVVEEKYLLRLKCPKCNKKLRAINIYFGMPINIQCPYCNHPKLDRQEYLRVPFYNPRPQDFFFNRSLLSPINSNQVIKNINILRQIPEDHKILFAFYVKPRKLSRIHPIKYYEKIGDNTIPVAYCNIRFPNINQREILDSRNADIDTGLICHHCQLPYLRDFNKSGDEFPKTITRSLDPLQKALKLFMLAKKYNNAQACIFMGISNKQYYRLRDKYSMYHEVVQQL